MPKWTLETETRVVALLRGGVPVREMLEICEREGLALKGHWVPQIAAKYDIEQKITGRPHGKNRQRARDLRNNGMSLRSIAAELGVSYQAIQDFLRDDKE